jgi:hypothetical protein
MGIADGARGIALHAWRALGRATRALRSASSTTDPAVLAREHRLAESRPYFRQLRNRYAGRRGFVIGNGPSLLVSDLERLVNEITIASNKVYLAYPQTAWRPTLFTIADPLVWEKVRATVGQHQGEVIVPSYLEPATAPGARVVTFRDLGNAADLEDPSEIPFSSDAEAGVFGGYTVTYENLQLAVHAGLNPIYLIGCDHYYAGESDAGKDTPVIAGTQNNHFLPNYRAPGEVVNPAPIAAMTRSYEYAREYATAHGIEIFNATRGGHLEVFPRAAIDSLL